VESYGRRQCRTQANFFCQRLMNNIKPVTWNTRGKACTVGLGLVMRSTRAVFELASLGFKFLIITENRFWFYIILCISPWFASIILYYEYVWVDSELFFTVTASEVWTVFVFHDMSSLYSKIYSIRWIFVNHVVRITWRRSKTTTFISSITSKDLKIIQFLLRFYNCRCLSDASAPGIYFKLIVRGVELWP